MTERYCEGERFTGLLFAGEVFESCDFADCRLQEIEWATLLSNGAFLPSARCSWQILSAACFDNSIIPKV